MQRGVRRGRVRGGRGPLGRPRRLLGTTMAGSDEGRRRSDAVRVGKLGRAGYRWEARGDRVVIDKQLRRLFAVLVGAWTLYSLVLALASKLDVRLVSVLLLAPLFALLCGRAWSFWHKVPSRLQASPEGLIIEYHLRRSDFLPGPIVYSMASKDLGGLLPYTEYEVIATAADGAKRTLVKAVSTDVDAAEMSPLLDSLNRSTAVEAATGESALGSAHTELADDDGLDPPPALDRQRRERRAQDGARVGGAAVADGGGTDGRSGGAGHCRRRAEWGAGW